MVFPFAIILNIEKGFQFILILILNSQREFINHSFRKERAKNRIVDSTTTHQWVLPSRIEDYSETLYG